MNKETRELLLKLKKDILYHLRQEQHSINEWTLKYELTSMWNAELIFYTACKLMVACGFGDEVI